MLKVLRSAERGLVDHGWRPPTTPSPSVLTTIRSRDGPLRVINDERVCAWVQLDRGALSVHESSLNAGDGARIEGPADSQRHGGAAAEVLVFELP